MKSSARLGSEMTVREVGSKRGDVLERFSRLQRTVMPLSKRTRRSARIERFNSYEALQYGRPDAAPGTK